MDSCAIKCMRSNIGKWFQHCTNIDSDNNKCRYGNIYNYSNSQWMCRDTDHCNSYSKSDTCCDSNPFITNNLLGHGDINRTHKQCCGNNFFMDSGANKCIGSNSGKWIKYCTNINGDN